MTDTKRCPSCTQNLPAGSFGWRDAAHSRRQGWCRRCLNRAGRDSAKQARRGAYEHLRNHFDTAITLCGRIADTETSHFYDQSPTSELAACSCCLAIDEQACIDADLAQRQERGPFDPNPYRARYLEVVTQMQMEEMK